MAAAVFVLCALASIGCAWLLWRGWTSSRAPLLLWAAASFGFFALNNLMLVIDEVVVPDQDLGWTRDTASFLAVTVLLVGLVWPRTGDRR